MKAHTEVVTSGATTSIPPKLVGQRPSATPKQGSPSRASHCAPQPPGQPRMTFLPQRRHPADVAECRLVQGAHPVHDNQFGAD
jgi:hypothetical protein